MARLSIALPALAGLALSVSSMALAQDASGGSWAGAYGGLHIGYGASSDDDVDTTGQAAVNVTNVTGGARPAKVSLDSDGFVGGIALGYNWQSGTLVYGLEADLDYTDLEETRTVNTATLPTAAVAGRLNNTFKQSLDYLGTLRARVGYAFNGGATLGYVTGGLAYGNVDNSVDMRGVTNLPQFAGSDDSAEYGFALGGGFEHAMQGPWRLTASYLYYDLGSETTNVAVIPTAVPLGGGTGYNSEFDTSGHLMRVGFGYKF